MAYLIFTKQEEAEAAQAKRDVELGYPESLDSLRWVGGGRHCPKEFGRALHYCRMIKHKDNDEWAILDAGKTAMEPEASKVSDLAADWFPEVIVP